MTGQLDGMSALHLQPSDLTELPASLRRKLVQYLLRWEHFEAALQGLLGIVGASGQHVEPYDNLARAYLGLGQPGQALDAMRRRHRLRSSASSQILEATAHLAARNITSAQSLADQVLAEHPDMLSAWDLQADICMAASDWQGAEAAIQQRDSRQPDSAGSAYRRALLWQRRGALDQALLWARTAVSRSERDARQPGVQLLRLLHDLHSQKCEHAQAQAVGESLALRRTAELEQVRALIEPRPSEEGAEPSGPAGTLDWPEPSGPAVFPAVYTGAVAPSADERRLLESVLARHFHHGDFRPGQIDVTTAVLRGRNVLAVMPTGSGKSLCYQIASLLLPKTTLVISPLIALMKDQVDGLPSSIAAQATAINSTLDGYQLERRMARAAQGDFKIVYAAPERLRQRTFLHALQRAGISLLVVDEAHCVSLWGHDFRPDYRFIAEAWSALGRPPLLCMTATATPRVRDDIQAAFGKMDLIATDVHRPNLRLEVTRFTSNREKDAAIIRLCQSLAGSGIVYARSRNDCERLAGLLTQQGVDAVHYHAGIDDRAGVQDRFMSGEARVVVATIAFGMGIDKADVRFIIHYNLPQSLENYYQEAGRAGRDGLPAHCVLFFSPTDRGVLSRFVTSDAMTLEFLRAVYAAVGRRLSGGKLGLLATADLQRDVTADETNIRVAIHFLETAGLLWRGFDLPRTATLRLLRPPQTTDGHFAQIVEAARLRPNQLASRSLIEVSQQAGMDAANIETELLDWSDSGWIQYRGSGRDMLLALPTPAPDSHQRVAALLADHRAGLEGRIGELASYATCPGCRHGFISRYFGGLPISSCRTCDNCVTGQKSAPGIARPSARKATGTTLDGRDVQTILRAVRQLPFPLVRTGLARVLKGSAASAVQADRFPLFGSLSRHSQRAISQAVLALTEQGLLEYRLRKGYWVLFLTEAGLRLLSSPPQHPTPEPEPPRAELPHRDRRQLFERLRAWRQEEAREAKVPPYCIFHDSVLRDIAAECPSTPEALLDVKGVGPRKLEAYGQAVLEIVSRQDTDTR